FQSDQVGCHAKSTPGPPQTFVFSTVDSRVLTFLFSIRYHLSYLFENDRHFSHLSTLEKEMAFRTEMGLYYSYYKTIIEAPSFASGLHSIMNDRLTEYPLVINTLKRFNLYPEVVLASWYRMYTSTMDFFGISTKMCWSVNRGEGLSPVESCEGLGDPAHFYVSFVFLLNGVMMSLFFLYGTYLSGSWLGGTTTVLCFFFNHGESTRVMWTPPLRESFSYPFLVLQMLLLTYILRYDKIPRRRALVALGVSNVLFMLPWQFAQFVLLTQISCLFASYIMGYLTPTKMQLVLITHIISLGVCFVLMFGNAMLLTSFYASSLVSVWVSIPWRSKPSPGKYIVNHVWLTHLFSYTGLFAWLISTIILKFTMSMVFGASDDAHISSLIKSKFTSYKDFDTLMYTCAAEFDFMEREVGIINILNMISSNCRLVFHTLQLMAFAVLAVLIMRLKLFLTPQMCLMGSLICSRQLFGWLTERYKHQVMVFAMFSMMAVQGVSNLQAQWNIMGEFSNLPQEELLQWIQDNTSPDSVFAGAMPTMASVKLSALRPIVNHPHYEDAGLRERTKLVYAMYSRMPADVVRKNLEKLQVDYYILEDSWCTKRSRPGCSMPEIWDVEDPKNKGKVPLCTIMSRDARPHFITVFQNSVYKVLRVLRTGSKAVR
uniref:Dpy-19-like 1, like (H. sapiens) n=1 Tax=Scleropages formosus TaxID=113540 RepID=A0A8C9TX47_SCLFO